MSSQTEKCFDALGLFEEVANVRGTLARTRQERLQWQREVADVRQRLATSEMSIASAGALPVNSITLNSSSAPVIKTAPTPSSAASTPNHTKDTSTRKAAASPESRSAVPAPSVSAPGNTPAVNAEPGERPLEVGSLIEKATQRVNPSYPQTARSARITGVVKVYLEIDENGTVATVKHTDGPQLLKQAATDAARRWKFRPTVVGGQPVRVMGYINFSFTL
jgi:TonB family protein